MLAAMAPDPRIRLPVIPAPMERHTVTETEIDPVCGMTVDPEEKPDLHLEIDGRSFWFCGKGCLLEFRDDPGRYLDPAYKPGGM